MIGALLLAACVSGADEAPADLPVAAEKATFATVASLGSHRLQASVRRSITAEGAAAQLSEESLELRWRDQDHWSYTLGRDGRLLSQVVVWQGTAWTNAGKGVLERKGDAEPYRVQLASVWDPWAWGLESLASAVAYDAGEIELVDGRRTRRHVLSLAPPGPKPRRGWTATAASGDVWIDEDTAVRLEGKVTVDAVSGARTQRVELLFSVDGIGVDPGISPPSTDKP